MDACSSRRRPARADGSRPEVTPGGSSPAGSWSRCTRRHVAGIRTFHCGLKSLQRVQMQGALWAHGLPKQVGPLFPRARGIHYSLFFISLTTQMRRISTFKTLCLKYSCSEQSYLNIDIFSLIVNSRAEFSVVALPMM